MTRNGWMIYGANGYTSSRIARAAKAQGLAPILAGRNATAVGALADALGLRSRAFDLADREATQRALHDVGIVAHCAGPFSLTGRPMVDARLAARAHYIDISGDSTSATARESSTRSTSPGQTLRLPTFRPASRMLKCMFRQPPRQRAICG